MTIRRLLAIELVKFKVPVNFIALAIYAALMVLMASISIQIGGDIESVDASGSSSGQVLSLQMAMLPLLMAVIILTNIGREFSKGTVKKNIIDGMSRAQWITGKMLASFLIYVMVFFFGLLIYFITGSLLEGFEKALEFYDGEEILRDFARYLYVSGFVIAIAIIVRNTALGFVIYLFSGFLENILNFALQKTFGSDFNFNQVFPANAAENIMAVPLENYWTLIVSIGYFCLFILLPYFIFLKRDLK
ncbi:MAG: ABC transporter permease [Luteibaculum sp.]